MPHIKRACAGRRTSSHIEIVCTRSVTAVTKPSADATSTDGTTNVIESMQECSYIAETMNIGQMTESVPTKSVVWETELMQSQISNADSAQTQPSADGTARVHDHGEVVDNSTMMLAMSTPSPTTSQALPEQGSSVSNPLLHQDSDTEECGH